jgi:hypothetical protein
MISMYSLLLNINPPLPEKNIEEMFSARRNSTLIVDQQKLLFLRGREV